LLTALKTAMAEIVTQKLRRQLDERGLTPA
jgi:hypothetical protein